MSEPREIRICQDCEGSFSGTKVAMYCPPCVKQRQYAAGESRKFWTEERLQYVRENYIPRERGVAKRIAMTLGTTPGAVVLQAGQLGLSRPRSERWRVWTPEDTAKLELMAGEVPAYIIARRLKRSRSSVHNKANKMGISLDQHGGDRLTPSELAQCLGVTSVTVRAWITQGKIRAAKNGPGTNPYLIERAAIVEFFHEHPHAVSLRTVDQLWFMDLVFGLGNQGRERRTA